MNIVVTHSHHIEWERLPKSAGAPTKRDIESHKVKELADGGWAMRVRVPSPEGCDHSSFGINELTVADHILHYDLLGTKDAGYAALIAQNDHTLSRALVAAFLASKQAEHHAHPKHFGQVEVHDDGPIESEFRRAAQRFVDEGHLEAKDVDMKVADYMADKEDAQAFFNKFFNSKAHKAGGAK